jgi:FK506-binding protein 4/5
VKRVLETMHSGEQVKCFIKGEWVEGCPGVAAEEELHLSMQLVQICEVAQVQPGVTKKTITEGSGYEKPNDGSKVSVRYSATLEDGTVFERTEGEEPMSFTVDEGARLCCSIAHDTLLEKSHLDVGKSLRAALDLAQN